MDQQDNHSLYSINLDYPLQSKPRYGWGKPPHPEILQILARGKENYAEILQSLLNYKDDYIAISRHANPGEINAPYWMNSALPGLDAAALYGFIRLTKPRKYFEIGVGNSTKFARQAISDQNLDTEIIAIDPFPSTGIEDICDTLVKSPLEDVNLEIFDNLSAGDILFVDNSHRVFMNSDATVVFLDILPRLKPGVLVEFHDIALPFDYPPYWIDRYYSEQYVLAAYLLAEGNKFEVILPNAFISMETELREILNPLWMASEMNHDKSFDLQSRMEKPPATGDADNLIEIHGSSFWIRMK